MADTERRRRRIRHEPSADAVDPVESSVLALAAAAETMPAHDPEVGGPASSASSGHSHPVVERVDDRDAERGLRGLVGAGSSQVSVAAAMRARDAARATDADLAAAESDLVIIRRGWVPRDPLTR